MKLIKNVLEITLDFDFDLDLRGNTIREAVQDKAVFTYDYKTFWVMYEDEDYECKEEKFMKLNIKYLTKPYHTSQDQKDYIDVKDEEYQMFNKIGGCAI